MTIKSDYSLQETEELFRRIICSCKERDSLETKNRETWPKYWGTLSNSKFQLSKLKDSGIGRGGQNLLINGLIYANEDDVYVDIKPMINYNHSLIIVLFITLIIYSVCVKTKMAFFLVILISLGMIVEIKKLYSEYVEFAEYVEMMLTK